MKGINEFDNFLQYTEVWSSFKKALRYSSATENLTTINLKKLEKVLGLLSIFYEKYVLAG